MHDNEAVLEALARAEARAVAAERKGRVRSVVSTGALAIALLVSAAPRAISQVKVTPRVTLESLQASLTAETNARIAADALEVTARNNAISTAIATEVSARNSAISSAIATEVTNRNAAIATETTARTAADNALDARADDLETLTDSMSVLVDPVTGENTVRFSDVNVQIVNGTNGPFTTTGTGNLILGYNTGATITSGSHNLVVGFSNSYSSNGGAVFGTGNTISALWATVVGGQGSTSTGFASAVLGGNTNTALGNNSTVLGGVGNTATLDGTIAPAP